MATKSNKIILYRGNGYDDEEVELPSKFDVCPGCEGRGTHVNRNIDGNGLTAEDFEEAGDDFREDYMNGVYDVTCETCGGQRVVSVLDEDRCDPVLLAEYQKQERESAECDAIQRAEMRAEAWAAGERDYY